MTEEQLDGQLSIFDLDGAYGKTSPEVSAAPEKKTLEKTSKQSSQSLRGSSAKKLPTFLYLKVDGQNQGASWVTEMTDAHFPSLGEFTMLSFGEQPSTLMDEYKIPAHRNGVGVSRLSQILEVEGVHQRFYLSAKACIGILNRAAKRGKALPEILKTALENQIRRGEISDSESEGGAEKLTPLERGLGKEH